MAGSKRGGVLLDLISGGYQAKPRIDPLAALMARPRMSPTERYWREKIAKRGDTIGAPKKSLGGTLEAAITGGLGKAGVGDRAASRWGNKLFSAINDATPVGNLTGAEAGGKQFLQGITQGDLAKAALGAGGFRSFGYSRKRWRQAG